MEVSKERASVEEVTLLLLRRFCRCRSCCGCCFGFLTTRGYFSSPYYIPGILIHGLWQIPPNAQCPAPSHPVSHCPTRLLPLRPIPSHPAPPRPALLRPVPHHPVPARLVLSGSVPASPRPVPVDPDPSFPSHPAPSCPVPTRPNRGVAFGPPVFRNDNVRRGNSSRWCSRTRSTRRLQTTLSWPRSSSRSLRGLGVTRR